MSTNLGQLLRKLIQKYDTPRHGIPRRIVPANNEQHNVAHISQGVIDHVGGIGVGLQHPNQVKRFFAITLSFMPQLGKALQTCCHVFNDDLTGNALTRSDSLVIRKHIGPLGQVVTLLPRVIKQSGEHLCRQIPTDQLDPIEGLVLG